MSSFWEKIVESIPIVGPIIGGITANKQSDNAKDATDQYAKVADQAAIRADQLEREKFEEAKKQADILRQRGDESAAVALEEATRAEMGAQKFQDLSNEYARYLRSYADDYKTYATQADQSAAAKDKSARWIYGQINQAADQRAAAGQEARFDILKAAQGVQDAAKGFDARLAAANDQGQGLLSDAFGNISNRYSPFINSEKAARGQLDIEMGLAPGDPNKGYRNTSAYMAAQDASRVAQEEAIGAIDQAAGNTGTLYSGTRGAALSDRAARGSYERAGIEQSYYQNYMDMLRGMANPEATGAVSGYESGIAGQRADMGLNTAGSIGNAYINAAGTGLNAQAMASQVGLDTLRTRAEGAELMQYWNPGTAGAEYTDAARAAEQNAANMSLGGFNDGMAGSPYRLQAQDYQTGAANNAAGVITGNMPNGVTSANLRMAGQDARLQGVEAQNAALADFSGGVGDMATAYMVYGPQKPTTQPAYMYQPQVGPYQPTNYRYTA